MREPVIGDYHTAEIDKKPPGKKENARKGRGQRNRFLLEEKHAPKKGNNRQQDAVAVFVRLPQGPQPGEAVRVEETKPCQAQPEPSPQMDFNALVRITLQTYKPSHRLPNGPQFLNRVPFSASCRRVEVRFFPAKKRFYNPKKKYFLKNQFDVYHKRNRPIFRRFCLGKKGAQLRNMYTSSGTPGSAAFKQPETVQEEAQNPDEEPPDRKIKAHKSKILSFKSEETVIKEKPSCPRASSARFPSVKTPEHS